MIKNSLLALCLLLCTACAEGESYKGEKNTLRASSDCKQLAKGSEHVVELLLDKKMTKVFSYLNEGVEPVVTEIYLADVDNCKKILSFDSYGSFDVKIEAISRYIGKYETYKIIVLASYQDIDNKSYSDFSGKITK